MMRRLAGRALAGLATLLALSALTFLLSELAPGDFLDEMRLDPRVPPETLDALRERYGLDRPLPVRYLSWLSSVARGELGYSFAHGRPVAPLLGRRALNSLWLTVPATLLAWLLALCLGTWAAARPGGWVDRSTLFLIAALLATPELLLALGGLMLAARSGLLPAGGMASVAAAELGAGARAADLAHHLLLPTGVLVLAALPRLLRHVRSSVAEALEAPFLAAARGHGVRRRHLLFTHALRAAANPLISLLGLLLAALLSGSLLVEVIFGWPGMGSLLYGAILARDLHVVVGCLLLAGALVIAAQLLADALLALADPRIRHGDGP